MNAKMGLNLGDAREQRAEERAETQNEARSLSVERCSGRGRRAAQKMPPLEGGQVERTFHGRDRAAPQQREVHQIWPHGRLAAGCCG